MARSWQKTMRKGITVLKSTDEQLELVTRNWIVQKREALYAVSQSTLSELCHDPRVLCNGLRRDCASDGLIDPSFDHRNRGHPFLWDTSVAAERKALSRMCADIQHPRAAVRDLRGA